MASGECLVESETPTPGGIQRIGCKPMKGTRLRGFVRKQEVMNADEVREVTKAEEREDPSRRGERGFGDENMGNGSTRLARK